MLVAVSGAGLIASQANALPITVTNPGFEDVLLTSDNSPVTLTAITAAGLPNLYYYNGKVVGANPVTQVPPAYVPGWSGTADAPYNFKADIMWHGQQAGVFNTGFQVGNNNLDINGDTVYQVLSDTLQADTTYTLTVLVARRNIDTNWAGYTVRLLAGATVLGTDTGGLSPLLAKGNHLT